MFNLKYLTVLRKNQIVMIIAILFTTIFVSKSPFCEEKNSIKVLSQGAALRFLLTRVFDALNKVEGAMVKIKDPMEYLKRLEFHKNSKNHEDYFF